MTQQKHPQFSRSRPGAHHARSGVACVELAVLAPLLALLFLGIVDMGQYVNLGQSVSNASRVGARMAAKDATKDVSSVQSAVASYLTSMHPNLSSSSVQVDVSSGSNTLSGTGIGSMTEGTQLSVQVSVPFSAVRWINGLPYLNGKSIVKSTSTRRE